MRLFLIAFDPETKALLKRWLDFMEGTSQGQIDQAAQAVAAATARLKASQTALQGAINSN